MAYTEPKGQSELKVLTVGNEYVLGDGNIMSKFIIRFFLTSIATAGLVVSATASADTIKRTSNGVDRVEEPRIYSNRSIRSSSSRSSSSNRSSSVQRSTSPQSNILNRRAPVRKPTTTYKPAQSTYQKPQRTYKPITTTKPTVNKYRPPVNDYRPPVNNYRPPINAYKPPTNNSVQRGSSSFRPVFPKPSVSTGLRRSDD